MKKLDKYDIVNYELAINIVVLNLFSGVVILNLIFDILALALAVLFIISGYKKGFIKSVLSFFNIVLATVLAAFLSFLGAEFVYENFVKSSIINSTNNTINNNGLLTATQKSQNLIENLPSFLVKAADNKGTLEKDLELLMVKGSQNAGVYVADLFKSTAVGLIRLVLFFILLTLLMFLLRFLIKFIKLSRVPVLGKVDSLFGAAFGLLKYVIFVVIFLNIANFLMPNLSDNNLIFQDSIFANSVFSKNIKDLDFKKLTEKIYYKS